MIFILSCLEYYPRHDFLIFLMLMLGIIAYMAGGAAVSLAYFEVIYMVVMLMEMLRLHVTRAVAEAQKASPTGARA